MQLCGCGGVSASSKKKLDNEVASEVLKTTTEFYEFWSRECAKDITYYKNVSTFFKIFSLAIVLPLTNSGSMETTHSCGKNLCTAAHIVSQYALTPALDYWGQKLAATTAIRHEARCRGLEDALHVDRSIHDDKGCPLSTDL
jgi:hypothetical protein